MLGTADDIRRDTGDLDPRRLGQVLLAAVLMAAGIGVGVLITSSAEGPVADTSVVNVPRLRHDPHAPAQRPPNIAPAGQVPPAPSQPARSQAPNPPVSAPLPTPVWARPTTLRPAPPRPVDVPVVIEPGAAPVEPPAPPPVAE
ncbi:hypothetical protein [Nocardia sp. NPDC005825]|uniref:hypothetical protein n=1 Tax=unclassified Nocardia TaxID=2637762 RepID=UPI0033FB6E1B